MRRIIGGPSALAGRSGIPRRARPGPRSRGRAAPPARDRWSVPSGAPAPRRWWDRRSRADRAARARRRVPAAAARRRRRSPRSRAPRRGLQRGDPLELLLDRERQRVEHVLGIERRARAVADQLVGSDRAAIEDPSRQRPHVAPQLERLARRRQRAAARRRLDDQAGAPERRDDAVADREVLRQRGHPDRELRDQRALPLDVAPQTRRSARIVDVEPAAEHGDGRAAGVAQRGAMRRGVDAAREARHDGEAGARQRVRRRRRSLRGRRGRPRASRRSRSRAEPGAGRDSRGRAAGAPARRARADSRRRRRRSRAGRAPPRRRGGRSRSPALAARARSPPPSARGETRIASAHSPAAGAGPRGPGVDRQPESADRFPRQILVSVERHQDRSADRSVHASLGRDRAPSTCGAVARVYWPDGRRGCEHSDPMRVCLGILALSLLLAASVEAKEKPPRAQGQVEFGVDMAQRGLWSEALFRFRQAERLGDNRASVLNNIAVAYEALGLFDQAQIYYKKALDQDPRNAGSQAQLLALRRVLPELQTRSAGVADRRRAAGDGGRWRAGASRCRPPRSTSRDRPTSRRVRP